MNNGETSAYEVIKNRNFAAQHSQNLADFVWLQGLPHRRHIATPRELRGCPPKFVLCSPKSNKDHFNSYHFTICIVP